MAALIFVKVPVVYRLLRFGDVFQTDDSSKAIRVHLKYTNNSSDGMYLSESFAIKAFQNDKELEDITDVKESSDVGDSAQNIIEVKDGASVNGSYVFKLTDDSEVQVHVCTLTVDENVLAGQKNSYVF